MTEREIVNEKTCEPLNEEETTLWHGVSRFERATNEEVERFAPVVRKMIRLYDYGDTLSYDEKYAAGLIGVAVGIEKYDPSRNVKYAYWVAYQIDKAIRNETRSVIRQRRYGAQPLDENFDPLDERGWREAEERVEDEERRALFNRALEALETLDPRARQVVRGLCFEGKTQEEIARELCVSQSWTSRLARSAFRKMRRHIAAKSMSCES